MNKTTKDFVIACGKYGLSSMLCTKYYDKRLQSFTAFTVLIPNKLNLPKTNVDEFLKSHFVKRRFNLDRITKYCSKLSSDGIVKLILGTMTTKTYEIDCTNFELYDGKNKFILNSETIHHAFNGCIYLLPGSIHI